MKRALEFLATDGLSRIDRKLPVEDAGDQYVRWTRKLAKCYLFPSC